MNFPDVQSLSDICAELPGEQDNLQICSLKLLQSLSEMACWTGRSGFYRLMAVSRCLGLRSILQSGTWS